MMKTANDGYFIRSTIHFCRSKTNEYRAPDHPRIIMIRRGMEINTCPSEPNIPEGPEYEKISTLYPDQTSAQGCSLIWVHATCT